MYEGWLTLAAWAQATEHVHIGLMVGANTFREPTLTAKMATTLDHISGGRAILGIGAAWFEEHPPTASGSGTGSRAASLARRSLPVIKRMPAARH
jgi:alkanesulfonate monooxygenase SsuD/methylene tetrahydromethanopterin reductase-like flavin-dependent oxidoreductase (luciferase family)